MLTMPMNLFNFNQCTSDLSLLCPLFVHWEEARQGKLRRLDNIDTILFNMFLNKSIPQILKLSLSNSWFDQILFSSFINEQMSTFACSLHVKEISMKMSKWPLLDHFISLVGSIDLRWSHNHFRLHSHVTLLYFTVPLWNRQLDNNSFIRPWSVYRNL